jgi:hypothetical protein
VRRILLVLAVAAVAVVAYLVLSGGGGESGDAKQVRATLAQYTAASDRKDYATICRRILAPHLLDQMRQIRLPCRSALARGLGSVQSPTLTVKSVKVNGTTALADVHAGAANQAPLDGTIELVKVGGQWRVLSLAVARTPPATAPAPTTPTTPTTPKTPKTPKTSTTPTTPTTGRSPATTRRTTTTPKTTPTPKTAPTAKTGKTTP